MSRLKYIVEKECFITCPLLRTDDFVRYCRDRNMIISREQLELWEKLKIFYPIARVRYPKMKIKIEYVNDRKQYKWLGVLKPKEKWSGDIKEEYSDFYFEKKWAMNWLEERHLWDPSERPFKEWSSFRDSKGFRQIESFYSIFQCDFLKMFLYRYIFRIGAHYLNYKNLKSLTKEAKQIISHYKANNSLQDKISFICQAIANRYYPETQTDHRRIQVSISGIHHHEWDWDEYCRNWNAKAVLKDLKIDINEIEKLQKIIAQTAESIDPLERWYELVSFVSVDRKKRLKGDALYAQALYTMEHMLRLFYKDLTGKELFPPDESSYFDKKKFYGEAIVENELKYLEFITNQYNLNPKPNLVLIVEGDGEEKQFPRLAQELFGLSFPRLGIEIMNLKGVGNFTGKKRVDKYGALEKFIDYYHNRQTIVFTILDNEGRVRQIKERLVKKPSKFYPTRSITKDEYIHIWNKSIEFDNFNYFEIAKALTNLAENKCLFLADEIKYCDSKFRKVGNPLNELFRSKTGYEIEKPKLLDILVTYIIQNAKNEFDSKKRPKRNIVEILMKIIDLARRNYQPATKEIWEKNQQSGWFGNLVKP